MIRTWPLFVLVGVMAISVGCSSDARRLEALGQAQPTVEGSLCAMGGLNQWRDVDRVDAVAIITTFDETGGRLIMRQRQRINLAGGTIKAWGDAPGGSYVASANAWGDFDLDATGFEPDTAFRDRIRSALTLEIHRLHGPMNLLSGREQVCSSQAVQLVGQPLARVRVAEPTERAAAYYFDNTCLLKYVTAGADEAGCPGTITTYTWCPVGKGLRMPTRLQVSRIGPNMLLGDEPVMDIELTDVAVR